MTSELRELDIAIAERVMRWPRRDKDDDVDYPDTYFSAYNDGGQIVVFRGGSQRSAERWSPAQNIEAAMEVEDRIAELGLADVYANHLCRITAAAQTNRLASTFDLIHATPEQRCRAALAAIERLDQ